MKERRLVCEREGEGDMVFREDDETFEEGVKVEDAEDETVDVGKGVGEDKREGEVDPVLRALKLTPLNNEGETVEEKKPDAESVWEFVGVEDVV